ncbi:hypothetical protein ACFYMO_00675 [Streptomyces sp. NPDC007025]|uniref:hypothetical protein n=1 Tax=Streptomyces sp. NPDC007025 TaxID=3364771 RepID=UPI0036C284FD
MAVPVLFVSLRVFVPASIPNGWAWGPWTHPDPAGIERLAELAELPRVLRSYAKAAAVLLRRKDADRFNVTAFGGRSGAVLGRDLWLWSTDADAYRAFEEPWVPGLSEDRLVTSQPVPAVGPLAPDGHTHLRAVA